jgi:hypothetical protein
METTMDERARDAAVAVGNAAVEACRRVAAAPPRPVLCEDTVENLTDLADRTTRKMRRGLEAVDDRRVEAAHCIKRHPFTSVGFMLAFGLAIGAVIGGFEMKRRLNALLREV